MASVTPVSIYLAAILCRHMYPKGNQVVIHVVGVHPGLLGKVEMESLQFVGCSWFMGLIGLVFRFTQNKFTEN